MSTVRDIPRVQLKNKIPILTLSKHLGSVLINYFIFYAIITIIFLISLFEFLATYCSFFLSRVHSLIS